MLFCAPAFSISAQDIGVLTSSSPTTGCNLTDSEAVTVTVFNYGPDLNSSFDIAYVIDGGTPVVETITLGSAFLSFSSYSHTFATAADLSIPGTFIFDIYTSLGSDTDNSNDTLAGNIIISHPLSVGGIVGPADTVCFGTNSGSVSLTGHTGAVQSWEESTDGGATWTPISNTNTTNLYSNLTMTTRYRAVVQSVTCPPIFSASGEIFVDALSIGGLLTGDTAVCASGNSGVLTLAGNNGSILDWEYSTDNGASWFGISNDSATENFSNLTVTTWYRVEVQNGVCSSAYSDTVIVDVTPLAVGGTVGGSASVCVGNNSGNVTLSGETGTVFEWLFSTDGGVTWTAINNTNTTNPYSNLTQTTLFRAVVQTCTFDTSSIATITVDSLSDAGTVTGDTTVCLGANTGLLNVNGSVGLLTWEWSDDNGSIWTPTPGTSSTEPFSGLSIDTWYRVIAQNGSCPSDTSSIVIVTVIPSSDAGTLNGANTVCALGNSDSVYLSSSTGSVLFWESSTDAGANWDSIGSTDLSEPYNNLTGEKWYRAIVQNGNCPADTSATAVIVVDAASQAGTLLMDTVVCEGSNTVDLTLIGNNGIVLDWESSPDLINWSPLVNPATTYNTVDLASATYYHSIVQNGTCPADTSNSVFVQVYPDLADAGADISISFGESVVLSGAGGATYLWSPSTDLDDPNSASPTASPTETTTYIAMIADTNGCVYTDTMIVTVTEVSPELIITNLVTANNDGFNDFWTVQGIDTYSTSAVTIFNGAGQTVFTASPYLNDWDGTYQGDLLPDGTYYYVLEIGDDAEVYKGHINILSN